MPYTYKALALVWVVIFGLFAVAGSGVVVNAWVLLLVLGALAVPLILTLSTRRSRQSANVDAAKDEKVAAPE